MLRANAAQVAVEEKVRPNDEARHRDRPSADEPAVLLPPINFIFKLLQSRALISVWLYENLGLRIEGKLRVCASGLSQVAHCILTMHRASMSL